MKSFTPSVLNRNNVVGHIPTVGRLRSDATEATSRQNSKAANDLFRMYSYQDDRSTRQYLAPRPRGGRGAPSKYLFAINMQWWVGGGVGGPTYRSNGADTCKGPWQCTRPPPAALSLPPRPHTKILKKKMSDGTSNGLAPTFNSLNPTRPELGDGRFNVNPVSRSSEARPISATKKRKTKEIVKSQ
ncbi:hypothetical protein EVAR_26532_1 [Eumeta japonica]|uniref:Uncharacterized protein n=1 Tax=Eumeta variegata TaxID=151549 RepID=A0A4C1YST1_EUMVA|nr:hypothetical protein EVAR_26532_1 [Eumeta japonica]